MKFFKDAIFYAVLAISMLCAILIYGQSVIGFVVVPLLTFMIILVAVAYRG